jgi:hypothetical protein
MFASIWTWLFTHSGVLSVILAAIPILWGSFSYIKIKNKEAKYLQFKTYHDLIRQLVEPEKPGSNLYLDRQIAVIFELREFKKYYPVTLRILQGLKESWTKPAVPLRLHQELDLTIKFLVKRSRSA